MSERRSTPAHPRRVGRPRKDSGVTTKDEKFVPPPDWAERIRWARVHAGIPSKIALATKIGYSKQQVQRWERGESRPELPAYEAIAEATGVSVFWLYHGGEQPTQPSSERPYPPVLAKFFAETPEGQAASKAVRELMRAFVLHVQPHAAYDPLRLSALAVILRDFPQANPTDAVAGAELTAELIRNPPGKT